MKKYFKVKKNYLIAGPILLFLALASFLTAWSIPAMVTRETVLVNYNQSGKFSYLINLKPSFLYGPTPQPSLADPRYPSAAVGAIDFTYSFSPAVKGQESAYVEAVLENPGIWQKKVVLVPERTFTGDFTLSFSLDPGLMTGLFKAVESETGITGTKRSLKINSVIKAGDSLLVQSLPVTLDGNLIEISNNLTQTMPEGVGKFNYAIKRNSGSAAADTFAAAKYPAAVVNTLDFSFNYQPVATGTATAAIEAVLENQDIWQTRLTLVAAKAISGNSELKFSLDLDSLINQFDEIDQATRLNTSPRLVTINATVIQGKDRFLQTLPITIDRDILELPANLQSVQSSGTGSFTYVVKYKSNTPFSSTNLKPLQEPIAPEEPVALTYDINLHPTLQPGDLPLVVLKPDQTAFTKLIDNMNVTLSYQFQSDQPVTGLNTDISISAFIEAPKSWSRTISLLQTSKSGNFTLTLPVDLASYLALVQAINSETGVSPESLNISILAKLHTVGETNSGKIDETFSPILKGTVTGNVLQWNKELSTNQPGSIKNTQTVANPNRYFGLSSGLAKTLLVILGFAFLFLFEAAVVLYIRTKPAQRVQLKNSALRINKKYGERLVKAVGHMPEAEKVITLGSMEDLIKVADDVAKPVICQASDQSKEACAYFVLDGTTLYQYLPDTGTVG